MPWLRHFALFVVFVAALFRPAVAGAFVSAPAAGSQARVGAFELVAATLVGPASGATCGLHEGIGAAYDENASGYRFAAGGGARVTGDALKAARSEFNRIKPWFWKNEAAANPGAWSAENLARMKGGKAPIGSDGFPMELHHKTPLAEGGTNAFDNLIPLTRTDHRLGPNYKLNHPDLP